MKEAKIKLDGGDLNGAIELALSAVKSNPTDVRARTFLFELSCFSGDWERGKRQLDVVANQDVNALIGAQIYKQNFEGESDRIRVFEDGMIPECLMPPPKYVENLLVAGTHLRKGRPEEAREVLDKAEEERPAFRCKVNGDEVGDFRDYNDLTMCVFEAIVKGSYTWIPFEQVENVVFTEPKSLRDLYWMQVEVEMINGTKGEMFFPSLYVNTFKHENPEIQLGRVTDWDEIADDIFAGVGTRLFSLDGEYKAIPDIQNIEFLHDTEV
ncbi:MAG: hypothetical protein HKN33_17545 [Pyrinomonadaceae bacterium]|nr:hypothetical protein [Pyrinomonadaceae bacterium]